MGNRIEQIERDLPCRDCGYNLRGLAPDARCPECSLPVADSTRGDAIEFASPAWLRRLQRGVRYAGAGCAAAGAIVFLTAVTRSRFGWTFPATESVALLVICAALTVSVFLLTTPDPREPASDGLWTRRNIARAGTPLCVLNAGLTILALRAGMAPGMLLAVNAFTGLSSPLGIATYWAVTSYLRELCLRLRQDDVADSLCLHWRWFLAWAIAVNLWMLLPQLIRAIPAPRWYGLGACIAPIFAGLLAFLLTQTITRLEKRLGELIQAARWREATRVAAGVPSTE